MTARKLHAIPVLFLLASSCVMSLAQQEVASPPDTSSAVPTKDAQPADQNAPSGEAAALQSQPASGDPSAEPPTQSTAPAAEARGATPAAPAAAAKTRAREPEPAVAETEPEAGCGDWWPADLRHTRLRLLQSKRADYGLPPTGPAVDGKQMRRVWDKQQKTWRYEVRDGRGRWQRVERRIPEVPEPRLIPDWPVAPPWRYGIEPWLRPYPLWPRPWPGGWLPAPYWWDGCRAHPAGDYVLLAVSGSK